jgi:hypothetical protein
MWQPSVKKCGLGKDIGIGNFTEHHYDDGGGVSSCPERDSA